MQQLADEVSQLCAMANDKPGTMKDSTQHQSGGGSGPQCWNYREYGHVTRNCSKRGGPRSSYCNWAPPTESAAVSSTLMVTGSIEGECMKMLIDTRSAVTILREDTWKRAWESCQLQLHPPVHSVVSANGEDLDLLGQSEVTLGIGLAEKHLILVANGLTQECLLGADFLMQHSCVVNLQKMSLCAGGETVGFISQCNSKIDPRPLSCHVM